MDNASPDFPMPPCRAAGTPPAGVPPSAGTFSPEPDPPEKPRASGHRRNGRNNWQERHAVSVFKTQDEAGRMLGHSGTWLGRLAQRHGLYKPTCGGGKNGAICHYHVLHIKHIENYILAHDLISEDDALESWNRKRQEIASEMQAALRPDKAKRGPKAAGNAQ